MPSSPTVTLRVAEKDAYYRWLWYAHGRAPMRKTNVVSAALYRQFKAATPANQQRTGFLGSG